MTQNPYAQFGQPGFGGEMLDPLDRRTSVLAILSLIAGLLCCLPGAGALAAILGGAAVIFISQSRGRLGGLGLAITGIVLGLLFSILWIAVAVGVSSLGNLANSAVFGPAGRVIEAVDKGDRSGARAMFTARADAAITDDMLDEFARQVRAELGGFKETPKGMVDLISGFVSAGQRMQAMEGRDNLFPVPVRFDRGTTVAVFQIDESATRKGRGGSGANFKMPIVNIGVVGLSGNVIWLVPERDASKLRMDAPGATPVGSKSSSPGSGGDGDDFQSGESPPAAGPDDLPDPPDPPIPPATPNHHTGRGGGADSALVARIG